MAALWLLVAVTAMGVYLAQFFIDRHRKLARMPPRLPGWPIIGNWAYASPASHVVVAETAPELGPVVTAEVSGGHFLFIRGLAAAKEIFLKQGLASPWCPE